MEIQIEIRREKKIVIFSVGEREINNNNAASLKEKLFLEIADGNGQIILDLAKVTEMDSSGIGALLFGKRQATNAGGNIVLVSVNPAILSLLRIAQLTRVFDTCDTLDQARELFQA